MWSSSHKKGFLSGRIAMSIPNTLVIYIVDRSCTVIAHACGSQEIGEFFLSIIRWHLGVVILVCGILILTLIVLDSFFKIVLLLLRKERSSRHLGCMLTHLHCCLQIRTGRNFALEVFWLFVCLQIVILREYLLCELIIESFRLKARLLFVVNCWNTLSHIVIGICIIVV